MGSSGFYWASSSPSPTEIESLEAAFPEVVSLPVDDLKSEMMEWQARAIIARSYQKWVSVEAFVREFRRAGIQGGIKPISLAFRCHIFQFEDPSAVESVLNRPWVINGQIIGMDRWKPEFVPSEAAIPLALVWVRLPNLPMEFWKEEFLRAITEAAGIFHCVDASTLAKSRGGFARVCLRVDLRRPLRPGIRVQGINLPFWVQIVYEFLEGFCPCCGSLHLEGPCSEASGSAKEEASSSPVFGAWMSAVRLRRETPGAKREERKKTLQKPAAENPGSVPLSQVKQSLGPVEAGVADEWRKPVKVAHRIAPLGSKVVVVPDIGASGSAGDAQKGKQVDLPKGEAVPVGFFRAGTVAAVKALHQNKKKASAESDFSQAMANANPFKSNGMGMDCNMIQGSGDAFPGPLKRPRSVDCPAPRSSSKVVKSKGKGKAPLAKDKEMVQACPVVNSLLSSFHEDDLEVSKPTSIKKVGVSVDESSKVGMDRKASSGMVSEGLKTDALMMPEGGNLASECLPDMVMMEDHGGVPAPSSF